MGYNHRMIRIMTTLADSFNEMRATLCHVLVLLAAVAVIAVESRGQSISALVRQHSPAVVMLEVLDTQGREVGQGSGFIVTSGGAIITSLHVVRGAASVRVRMPGGESYLTSDLVAIDEQKDIAILRIIAEKLPTAILGDSEKVEPGDPVIVISSPEGLQNSISTGIISGMRRLTDYRVFQITAPIGEGSSGGAIFDAGGRIIGIATYVLRSGQNINFAIPINYARGLISEQVTRTLASLGTPTEVAPRSAENPARRVESDSVTDEELKTPSRGKLGRNPLEPMFPRPDEALALAYRLVDGLGLLTIDEVTELTRTAALIRTATTERSEDYTIRYLSYHLGLTLRFSRNERLLTAVDLLVTWSIDDLRNTFGDKFKRRTLDGQPLIDYGRLETGRLLVAFLDPNDNVRTIRFTRPEPKANRRSGR